MSDDDDGLRAAEDRLRRPSREGPGGLARLIAWQRKVGLRPVIDDVPEPVDVPHPLGDDDDPWAEADDPTMPSRP